VSAHSKVFDTVYHMGKGRAPGIFFHAHGQSAQTDFSAPGVQNLSFIEKIYRDLIQRLGTQTIGPPKLRVWDLYRFRSVFQGERTAVRRRDSYLISIGRILFQNSEFLKRPFCAPFPGTVQRKGEMKGYFTFFMYLA